VSHDIFKLFLRVLFAHVAINHSHSQRPVPEDFPLFKRCEWLVGNWPCHL